MKKDRPRVSDGSGGRGTETALREDRERNCNLKWREWEEGKEGAPSLIAPSLGVGRVGFMAGGRSAASDGRGRRGKTIFDLQTDRTDEDFRPA